MTAECPFIKIYLCTGIGGYEPVTVYVPACSCSCLMAGYADDNIIYRPPPYRVYAGMAGSIAAFFCILVVRPPSAESNIFFLVHMKQRIDMGDFVFPAAYLIFFVAVIVALLYEEWK